MSCITCCFSDSSVIAAPPYFTTTVFPCHLRRYGSASTRMLARFRSVIGFRRWALGVGRWALGVGRWALGVGRWALGVGRWALGVGRWELGVEELTPSSAKGLLVAFEGLDQSGKQTQAEMLKAAIEARGRNAVLLDFP